MHILLKITLEHASCVGPRTDIYLEPKQANESYSLFQVSYIPPGRTLEELHKYLLKHSELLPKRYNVGAYHAFSSIVEESRSDLILPDGEIRELFDLIEVEMYGVDRKTIVGKYIKFYIKDIDKGFFWNDMIKGVEVIWVD